MFDAITWWGTQPRHPACPSSSGCRRNVLSAPQEFLAKPTSQISWWPSDVSGTVDNTWRRTEEVGFRLLWGEEQGGSLCSPNTWQTYQGSCSPRVSVLVKSWIQSVRATVTFFFCSWSMDSCFTKACKEDATLRTLEKNIWTYRCPFHPHRTGIQSTSNCVMRDTECRTKSLSLPRPPGHHSTISSLPCPSLMPQWNMLQNRRLQWRSSN